MNVFTDLLVSLILVITFQIFASGQFPDNHFWEISILNSYPPLKKLLFFPHIGPWSEVGVNPTTFHLWEIKWFKLATPTTQQQRQLVKELGSTLIWQWFTQWKLYMMIQVTQSIGVKTIQWYHTMTQDDNRMFWRFCFLLVSSYAKITVSRILGKYLLKVISPCTYVKVTAKCSQSIK